MNITYVKRLMTVCTVALALASCAPVEDDPTATSAEALSRAGTTLRGGLETDLFVAESPNRIRLREGVAVTAMPERGPTAYALRIGGGGWGGGGGGGYAIQCTCAAGCAGACIAAIDATTATCSGSCPDAVRSGDMCANTACQWRSAGLISGGGVFIH